jgi:LTXXQ motif family protein
MNIKFVKLSAVLISALFSTVFQTAAMAEEHCDQMSMGHEQMHRERPAKMQDTMKSKLDKLAERLELRASQQSAWDEFSKSVGMLADRNMKKIDDNADAVAIARYRADRASEMAGKLNSIAGATAKLRAVLNEDQRKILDQVANRFTEMKRMDEGMGQGMDHMMGNGMGKMMGQGMDDHCDMQH